MQIEDLMERKRVLLIPVYSTRSYETGNYDLSADGNISKFLIKMVKSNAKSINILFPQNSINTKYAYEFAKKNVKCKVRWLPTVLYGVNAHETRNAGKDFIKLIKGLSQIDKYDLIITEIDSLANLVANNDYDFCKKENFLYWAGSWNADGTPWYAEGHNDINKNIAKEITTACLLPGQVDFYGGKTFYDECIYEPKLFDKKVIFFPFRLTDKSYKLDLLKDTIKRLLENKINNFVVLYSDPNDSKLLDKESRDVFIKVPKNKYVYLSILKGKPIIPFFDDPLKNYHSNIFEFTYYNCDVIMYKNTVFNATQIENDAEFYETLKNKLEG